jgi:hypothetical protein
MTDLLKVVEDYRRATRQVVRADRPHGVRCLALIDLAKAAREEEDLTVRDWAQRAVWVEARPFLQPDSPPDLPSDPMFAAARKLNAQGMRLCPTCHRPPLLDLELDRIAQSTRRWYLDRRIHEEAVHDA